MWEGVCRNEMYGWKRGLSPILGDFEIKNVSYFLLQSNQYEGFAWNITEKAGMGGKRARVTGGGGGGCASANIQIGVDGTAWKGKI